MILKTWPSWLVLLAFTFAHVLSEEDYNIQQIDGSYEFGYDNANSYHHSKANRNNVVRGEFGGRDPKTGGVVSTSYTAGPRGYRPRGKNIVRKFDQNQSGRRPIGSRDDPYFDPNEDPSYSFGFKTRTYSKQESANRIGDVTGKYSYRDDVGELHNVEYIAGSKTGFHVKTPFPDSNPRAYGPLYFNGRGKPIPRGRTSIQRGLDGSYRFVSSGPDQRRTETSDALGNVRGSYTYLDDKGLQHSVHYIAGPQIGYRVLKNVKGPHLPTVFPFAGPNIVPPDFYNYLDRNSGQTTDLFDTAASGHVKPNRPSRPTGGSVGGGNKPSYDDDDGDFDSDDDNLGRPTSTGGSGGSRPSGSRPGGSRPVSGSRPAVNKPNYDDDGGDDADIDDDLFGGGGGGSSTVRPGGSSATNTPGGGSPSAPLAGGDDGGSLNDNDDEDDDGSDLFGAPPSRPNVRPGGTSTSRPPVTSRPTSRPSGGRPIRPGGVTSRPGGRPSRPTYEEDDNDSNNVDDDLFGGGGSSPTSKPQLTIGVAASRPGSSGSFGPGHHTIVTNVGDSIFTVPPGVSVKAHVQSIDLFPYESKVPSPSDQYRAEMSNIDEQIVEASEIHAVTTTIPSSTILPSTLASTISTISTTENANISNVTASETTQPVTTEKIVSKPK